MLIKCVKFVEPVTLDCRTTREHLKSHWTVGKRPRESKYSPGCTVYYSVIESFPFLFPLLLLLPTLGVTSVLAPSSSNPGASRLTQASQSFCLFSYFLYLEGIPLVRPSLFSYKSPVTGEVCL
jgi:hypothetical protein